MHIRVMTTDGILETEEKVLPSVAYQRFDEFVASYIDTEGQPDGGGFVVQLINNQDSVLAEETQESY